MKLKLFLAVFALAFFFLSSSVNAQVERKIKLTNKTGIALSSVRISTHESFRWGMDLNTMSTFPINGTIEFRQKVDTNLCAYDIKFADAGGKEYVMQSVDLCKEATVQLMIPEEKSEEKIEEKK